MDAVVGRIGPAMEVLEAPSFTAPIRTLLLSDTSMKLHGEIKWLATEVDEEFLAELAVLCSIAMRSKASRSPASASP